MAKLNRPQLKGKESIKNVKPSKKPPVTAAGKPGIDASLENPRGYLGSGFDGAETKEGFSVITKDLDIADRERNPNSGISPDDPQGEEQ